MSPSPLGRMPLQAIPYRLYHIPITGPDLLHHLVPGLVNPVLSGFGRRSTTEKAWKSCPYEGAGEGRRLAKLRAAFVAGGQPQQLFQSWLSGQSRSARAQRARRTQLLASTPVHRVRASRVITCDGAINASANYNTEPCLTRVRANKLSYHVAQWRETVNTSMQTARQAGNKCMSSWVQVACKHKLRYKIKQR